MLGGQLGDLPLPSTVGYDRVDLFQVPCTSYRAAGRCECYLARNELVAAVISDFCGPERFTQGSG